MGLQRTIFHNFKHLKIVNICPSHLLGDVVPVHVTLACVHLFLVEEAAAVGHQQGLTHILAICSWIEEDI